MGMRLWGSWFKAVTLKRRTGMLLLRGRAHGQKKWPVSTLRNILPSPIPCHCLPPLYFFHQKVKLCRHQQCSGSHSTQKASLFQELWKEYTTYVIPSRGASIVRLPLPRRKDLAWRCNPPSIAGKALDSNLREGVLRSALRSLKQIRQPRAKKYRRNCGRISDQEQTEGKWCLLWSTKRSKLRAEI